MSNLSGLPPSALGRVAAQTVALDIAVRIVNLPDDMKHNPVPLKVQGVVTGQNPDGSVQVNTDRGAISLMLRDRQSLPVGQTVEIEIPAGRSPQQATLRPAPASQTTPSLASQLAHQAPLASTTAAALRLDRSQPVRATEIADALRMAASKLADVVSSKLPAAPLQPGQNLRLIPIPPGQTGTVPLQPGQVSAMAQGELIAALTALIEQLPAQAQAQKADLQALVARMNTSGVQPLPEEGTPATPLASSQQSAAQPLDLDIELNSIRYEPTKQFSLIRPLDVQVAATFSVPVRPGVAQVLLPAQIQVAPAPTSTPGTPATTPATAAPPEILPGQVVGFTANNLPVISLPVPNAPGLPLQTQLYVGQFQTNNLAPGSPVLVSVLPQTPLAAPPPLQLGTWLEPGPWDSLTDLLQSVHQVNPALAHGLTQMLPSPSQPQTMGGLALFFMSVMRSGDLESLLQPQTMALLKQAGKGDVLRLAAGDIAATGRTESIPLGQDWRATLLPFYHDQQVHKLPLYYKRMKEDGDDKDRERRTRMMRFLFDLKLSRMGNVQIDGFMQPERLDMIMRTRSPLSNPMQRTMKGLYVTAMEKSNLHGELSFQFKPEHWVSIDVPSQVIESPLST